MKVLVISHNCFSDFQNMGKTLMRLFNEFNINELCQLYFYPTFPNIDVCNSYFKVTDIELINNVFNRKSIGSIVEKSKIDHNNNLYYDDKTSMNYSKYTVKNQCVIFLRNFIWSLGRWKSIKLDEWLINENPSVIFYAAGDFIFSYKIALYISKKYKVPLVTYFCDDYYSIEKFSLSPLFWFNKIRLRSTIKKIILSSQDIVYISSDFEKFYYDKTGKHGKTIMTPYSQLLSSDSRNIKESIIVSYIGNLNLLRWETVLLLSDSIDKYNRSSKIKIHLDIYSQLTSDKITGKFSDFAFTKFRGSLSADEVVHILSGTDYLLHVESFNHSMVNKVKYSISTKIPDYLSSGKPIVAIGPETVASIKYLLEFNAAKVITDPKRIYESLDLIVNQDYMYKAFVNNAMKLAKMNHDIINNSKYLKKILLNANFESK